jgi:hypothetical protein
MFNNIDLYILLFSNVKYIYIHIYIIFEIFIYLQNKYISIFIFVSIYKLLLVDVHTCY